jgi:hypothetical protein
MKPQLRYCSIPYYRRDQYDHLRNISIDKDTFSISYDEMVTITEARCHDMEERGFEVFKIDVNVDELSDWCNTQGVEISPESRTRFAIMKLKELIVNSNFML